MSRSAPSRLACAALSVGLAGAVGAPGADAAMPAASTPAAHRSTASPVAPAIRAATQARASRTTTKVWWQQRNGVGSFWKVTRMYRNGYTITRYEGYSCVLTCAYEGPTYVRSVGHGHTFWFLLIAGKLIPV